MAHLAFIGLDPDVHEIWEVALILRDGAGETEHLWELPVDLGRADPMALDLGRADPMALKISGFHERRRGPTPPLADFAEDFAGLTIGAHLVGAVVSFDEERLRRLLRRYGQCPMWHYHLIDVEALAAGYLRGRYALQDEADEPDGAWQHQAGHVWCKPPWDSEELSSALGVLPGAYDRHTALGDAQWARDIYDAVIGGA